MIVTIDVPDVLLESLRRFYPLWQQDEAGTLPEEDEDELNDLYEELGPVVLQRLAAVVAPVPDDADDAPPPPGVSER